jgi:hypothetical protein
MLFAILRDPGDPSVGERGLLVVLAYFAENRYFGPSAAALCGHFVGRMKTIADNFNRCGRCRHLQRSAGGRSAPDDLVVP